MARSRPTQAASARGRKAATLPKGAWEAHEARKRTASRFEEGTRHGLRRPPAASASVPRQLTAWERRAAAAGSEGGGLTPGSPQITSCASMRGATKSQHGGGCKALWIRLGVDAPKRVHVRRRASWPGAPVEERPSAGHCTCSWRPKRKLASPMAGGLSEQGSMTIREMGGASHLRTRSLTPPKPLLFFSCA